LYLEDDPMVLLEMREYRKRGNMDLILASASPRRAELLEQIGLNFQIIPSTFQEETLLEADPARLVMELALNKARQVAGGIPGGLVIGADTIVFLEGQILGKPSGIEEAIRMLAQLSGKAHRVFTGIALIEVPGGKYRVNYEMTRVQFRSLSRDEIEAYVSTQEPFDKAGAYGIQGKGAVLVESIHGCYFNVVGLPIARLVTMLQDFGVSLW
jgi:septum formation protein